MMWTDNPVRDANDYELENEKRLEQKPQCECCGEHIDQESAVRINGMYFCDNCIDGMREDLEV